MGYFLASVNELFEYALQDVSESDMVGITIQNQVNLNDKPIGIRFRRKDQLSEKVIWSVFEKVSQSNARYNALDTLVVTVHSVKMPVGYGKHAIKCMGRPLSVMSHLKRSIVEMQAEENILVHALLIAIAKVDNDANYTAYRKVRKIRPVGQALLQQTGINLTNGGGIPELNRFQEHFRDYKIVGFQSLGCDDIMHEGLVDSSKHLNLLYDDVDRHYHVITNLTYAMAKRYVFKACHKSCGRDITHVCDQTCSDCMASSPCTFSEVRFPCDECNRHFLIRTCFANHKHCMSKRKSVCERKRCCATCGRLVTDARPECNKGYYANCKQNRDVGHLCYIRPLKVVLPDASEKVLYILRF